MKSIDVSKRRLGGLRGLSGTNGVLTGLFVLFMITILPVAAYCEDSLVVKHSSGATAFVVSDMGQVWSANTYYVRSENPGLWLDKSDPDSKGVYFVLDNNWMQVQRRTQGFGAYEASPMLIHIEAPSMSFVVASNGNVGLQRWDPAFPLHMESGAYCSTGGVWTNASSREYKQDIKELTRDEAMETLNGLNPVKFAYKADADEKHVGFIAEDVPDLVATKDKKGTSSMDVVAVLTKVVQEQQKTIAELSQKMADLENQLKAKDKMAMATAD